MTTIFHAIQNKNIDACIKLIYENEENVKNVFNTKGESLLHKAVQYNLYPIADILINKGAYVNDNDVDGNTALFYVTDDSLKIAELLIKHNININHYNKDNDIALHHALYHGYTTLASLLINNGSNILFKNKKDESCLDYIRKYNIDFKL